MHLLVSSISKDVPKWEVENIIEKYDSIHHMMWLLAENGRKKIEQNDFMMVGSINNLFRYEEENVLMVEIEGIDTAKSIQREINNLTLNTKHTHQFLIPVTV